MKNKKISNVLILLAFTFLLLGANKSSADVGDKIWEKAHPKFSAGATIYKQFIDGDYIYIMEDDWSNSASVVVHKNKLSDGAEIWSRSFPSGYRMSVPKDIRGKIVRDSSGIYVILAKNVLSTAFDESRVYKISLADGSIIWGPKIYTAQMFSAAVEGSYLYTLGYDNLSPLGTASHINVKKINSSDGSLVWNKDPYQTAPTGAGNPFIYYVSSYESLLVDSTGLHITGYISEGSSPNVSPYLISWMNLKLDKNTGLTLWLKKENSQNVTLMGSAATAFVVPDHPVCGQSLIDGLSTYTICSEPSGGAEKVLMLKRKVSDGKLEWTKEIGDNTWRSAFFNFSLKNNYIYYMQQVTPGISGAYKIKKMAKSDGAEIWSKTPFDSILTTGRIYNYELDDNFIYETGYCRVSPTDVAWLMQKRDIGSGDVIDQWTDNIVAEKYDLSYVCSVDNSKLGFYASGGKNGSLGLSDYTQQTAKYSLNPTPTSQFVSQSFVDVNSGSPILPVSGVITVAPGQTFTANIVIKNISEKTWEANKKYALSSLGILADPSDRAWASSWKNDSIILTSDVLPDSVDPSKSSLIINKQFTAPMKVDSYNFQWQMSFPAPCLGNKWFGEKTPMIMLKVQETDLCGPAHKRNMRQGDSLNAKNGDLCVSGITATDFDHPSQKRWTWRCGKSECEAEICSPNGNYTYNCKDGDPCGACTSNTTTNPWKCYKTDSCGSLESVDQSHCPNKCTDTVCSACVKPGKWTEVAP